jgi:hypothetical protein
MAKAFISHSTSDQKFVESVLIPLLKEVKVTPWYSKTAILTAEDWERSIRKGLETSDWFLVVLSPRSVSSRWVKAEVHWALEHRPGRVVPIMSEPCNPAELHIGLSLIQHIDLSQKRKAGSAKLREIWERDQSLDDDGEPIYYNPPPPAESGLLKTVRDEATLARIRDIPFDILMFGANFMTVNPEEVALAILGNQAFSFRVDFDQTGVTISTEGYDGFYTPLTPSTIEVSKEISRWMHIVDLNYLRQVDPLHPLARLSPNNLENVPVQPLLHDRAISRLSTLKNQTHLSMTIAGEVSGYVVSIFSRSLTFAGSELKNLRFPRPILGKQGFSPLVMNNWKTQLEFGGESGGISLRDVARSVDYLERQNHIEGWRGIWPDLKIQQYFNRTHKVPFDENTLIFHPWNQQFVQLRKDVEESCGCSVPGIAAFQLPSANAFFYLFTTVSCQDDCDDDVTLTKDGKRLSLSRREMVAILNILRQLTVLNYTWVKVEGNYIQGLCVLLPPRRKYIILSSKLYYEHNLRYPHTQFPDFEKLAKAALSASITMMMDLPS